MIKIFQHLDILTYKVTREQIIKKFRSASKLKPGLVRCRRTERERVEPVITTERKRKLQQHCPGPGLGHNTKY